MRGRYNLSSYKLCWLIYDKDMLYTFPRFPISHYHELFPNSHNLETVLWMWWAYIANCFCLLCFDPRWPLFICNPHKFQQRTQFSPLCNYFRPYQVQIYVLHKTKHELTSILLLYQFISENRSWIYSPPIPYPKWMMRLIVMNIDCMLGLSTLVTSHSIY